MASFNHESEAIIKIHLNRAETILYVFHDDRCTHDGIGNDCEGLKGTLVSVTRDEKREDIMKLITKFTWTTGVGWIN